MSQTDLLLIAGDDVAAGAASSLCNAEGIPATIVSGAASGVDPIESIAAGLTTQVEEVRTSWILYLREGEFLTRGLLNELKGELARETPRAYAFRLRRNLFDGAAPLMLDDPLSRDGEIRLLFRRRARYRPDGSLTNSGTVLRLSESLHVDVVRSGLVGASRDRHRAGGLSELVRKPTAWFHPPTASFILRYSDVVRDWRSGLLPGRAPASR